MGNDYTEEGWTAACGLHCIITSSDVRMLCALYIRGSYSFAIVQPPLVAVDEVYIIIAACVPLFRSTADLALLLWSL